MVPNSQYIRKQIQPKVNFNLYVIQQINSKLTQARHNNKCNPALPSYPLPLQITIISHKSNLKTKHYCHNFLARCIPDPTL